MRHDVLDYAPLLDIAPGLGRLGRSCIAFMAFFLLLDALLLATPGLSLLIYQPLCFLSLGGFVAGAMGIGVAAMEVKEFRPQLLLCCMSVLCVLATLFVPLFSKA